MPLDLSGDGTLSGVDIAASGLGKVLQVVQETKTTGFTTSSTSFTDITGLSVAITPSSISSKVLCFVSITAGNTSATQASRLTILRDGTNLAGTQGLSSNYDNAATEHSGLTVFFLDNPSTTSSTTYTAAAKVTGGTGFYNQTSGGTAFTAVILAIEVAA